MTKQTMADVIRHQLKLHGYDVCDAAARDTAAQILQVLVCESDLDAHDMRDAISEAFAAARADVAKLEQERKSWRPADEEQVASNG